MSFDQDVLKNIILYSYGLAWLAFALLAATIAINWRHRELSLSVLVCAAMTSSWAGIAALGTLTETPPVKLLETAEAARNAGWVFLLHTMYGMRLEGRNHFLAARRWVPWYTAGIALVLLHLYALPLLLDRLALPPSLETDLTYVMWIGFALAIVMLTEQIYRLSTEEEQWVIKYLCLALVCMYGYDFLMYSQTLVTRQLDPVLWQARGAVVAMTAPLIAVAVLRGREHSAREPVPRHLVFHTFTLLIAGTYLIYTAGAGYLIQYFGGSWGGVGKITFFSASGLVFLVLMASSRMRNLLKVWMSKHFFSYRYDYRREWLDFTDDLANSRDETPRAVTMAMTKLCGSPAGLLWARSDGDDFILVDCWNSAHPEAIGNLKPLVRWLEQRQWIIDFPEWRRAPQLYRELSMPEGLAVLPQLWLLIPLMFADRLQGMLIVERPAVLPDMNWEDRDLLKVAGRAAATHLAQYQASQTLVGLRQFEAFNRLSAYVVHDLKNILAQQSLIVFNAIEYRDDPEFIDDVFETIGNSVDRMKGLMAQMRSGMRGGRRERLRLGCVLSAAVAARSGSTPSPALQCLVEDCEIDADEEQLTAVLGHLIQNAQEATPYDGSVAIRLRVQSGFAIVEIEDSGCGMDALFIERRLFKPFDTTKGLANMGIGAYESREYIRQLGGEIVVRSEPGKGSCFTVAIPLVQLLAIETQQEEVAAHG